MHEVTTALIDLLCVEYQSTDSQGCEHYTGHCQDLGFRNLFGGQILGQSLYACMKSAPEEFLPHSLHAYFLLPGRVDTTVDIKVECLRKGKSFATYRVDVLQDERIIFTQDCNFQRPEEGMTHQQSMPEVKEPDKLLSQLEMTRMFQDMFPESVRKKFTADKPLEMKQVETINIFDPQKREPKKHVWVKSIDSWESQSKALQYALLAYSSDFHMLSTALLPHGVSVTTKGIQLASLDHAMWFHHEPRWDDWLLFALDSPAASGARGLNFAHIYHKDGQLLTTVAQEGLMRLRT